MKKYCFAFCLFLVSGSLIAQEPFPFWNDIQQFKKSDSISFPARKQILFVGSSSFTYWKDVKDYFPGKPILNRAFGGSTLVDLMRYRYEVILPYQPKQIVMYCGENDFAASDTVSVETVVGRFKALFSQIRARYPQVPFVYVSMKPSPSRAHLMPKYKSANEQIKSYLSVQKNTSFADVYSAMLKVDGSPMDDIFLDDKLHMNASGYAIWKKILTPLLIN